MKKILKLISKKEIAENTLEFCLEKPEDLIFKNGQHFVIRINNLPVIDAKGNERVFSVVSSAKDQQICFATRVRNSAFKIGLANLRQGDEIEVEGPYGYMVLPKNIDKDLIFIAGGIGITPFIGMIRYAIQENLQFKIYLFYSNRRPEDAAYLDELLNYNKQGKVKLIATMTQWQNSRIQWEGEKGYINEAMLRKYVPNIDNAIFYIAGPSEMVLAIRSLLEKIGINEEIIKSEDFTGY